jgi:hypothetical protein
MAAFNFLCPSMRLIVEGWIADDPTGDNVDTTYECVICTACLRAHWVNPKTGKVLGADHLAADWIALHKRPISCKRTKRL